MRVSVLGASGFIGRHLVDRLISEGHEVVGFSRHPINSLNDESKAGRYKHIFGDFRQNELQSKLNRAIDGAEICFHLISASTPAIAEAHPFEDVASNFLPTINLIEQIQRKNKTKLVFISSGGTVYGDAKIIPTPEHSPLLPNSFYGLTKATIERYIQAFGERRGLNYTIVRPSNIYGAPIHERSFGIIQAMLKKIFNQEPLVIWGDGKNIRDYLYIEDAIDFLMRTLEAPASPAIVNVATGKGHTILDVVQLVEAATGRKAFVSFTPARPLDVRTSILDISLAKQTFGWEPKTNLADGIDKMVKNCF